MATGVWTGTAGFTDNVAEFNAELHAAMKAFPQDANKIKRTAAMGIMRGVILHAPIDTGRYRDNWQASLGSPIMEEVAVRGEAATMMAGMSAIAAVQPGQDIYITNNVPYVEVIEDGHSDRAPHGVAGVTLIEVTAGLRALNA